MLLISRYNEVLESGFSETAPHKICQYIYELSNAFNSFYHETKILTEPDEARKDSFIGLITLARRVLETCIGLLGIEAPDRMRNAERKRQSNEDSQDEHQQLLERRGWCERPGGRPGQDI